MFKTIALFDEADENGWLVIDMVRYWQRIFP
jgi:hypothetical protein